MADDFPRTRNGWVDSGDGVPGAEDRKCPNCNSSRYYQTISTENCPACGLYFDYWGSGGNEIYQAMEARNHEIEEQRQQEELDAMLDAMLR